MESADKPGSVEDDHSSGTPVTGRLVRPTRRHLRAAGCPKACLPIWSCSRGGLPCHPRYRGRGALLPHHFTLTWRQGEPDAIGGLLSVALSVGSRRPGVTWPLALRSPDFPPSPSGDRDRLADSAVHPRPSRPGRQAPQSFVISRARRYIRFFFSPVILAARPAACFTGNSSSKTPSRPSTSTDSLSPPASAPATSTTISPLR